MKIKLDENIPLRVQALLQQLGHDADSVYQENLVGATDESVWQSAQEAGRFLITQDMDFSNIQRFKPGTHAGILMLRLHSSGREAILQRVQQVFQTETVEVWQGCFVVVTERKIASDALVCELSFYRSRRRGQARAGRFLFPQSFGRRCRRVG
jgi:predicted nuclease of predicted toxin-antitoxin system